MADSNSPVVLMDDFREQDYERQDNQLNPINMVCALWNLA